MRAIVLVGLATILAACSAENSGGPEPYRPDRYRILFLNTNSVPATFWGGYTLDSAFLIPYGMGRTIDRRLVNDRTGRGGTGGNTRDTTIARGQFMDIRVLSGGAVRDSTIVDVMVQDTVVVITRPSPDPTRVRVDSGWFQDGRLYVPTLVDYRQKLPIQWPGNDRPCPLEVEPQYTPKPCVYRAQLVYIWE